MQIKTTDSRFLKYGDSFRNVELLNRKNIQDISISEKNDCKLYYAIHDIFVSELDGIIVLKIGKTDNINELESFILSKTTRIRKGYYLLFSSVAKESHMRIYNNLNDLVFIKSVNKNDVYKISETFDISKFYFCSYSMKTAGYHFDSEKHSCWEITYVDDGELISNVDGKDYILKKEQFMFYVPNQRHSQDISLNSNCSYLTIAFETNLNNYDYLKNKVFTCDDDTSSIFSSIINNGNNIRFIDDLIKLKIKELIIICCNISNYNINNKNNYSNDKLLNSIIDYINDHIKDDMTVDKLCYIFGVSRTKIQKLFNSKLNISPKDYIIATKMSYSKILLKQNKYNIEEISSMTGFTTANYFSRMFKKVYKVSPTEYIKRRK